VADIIFNGPGHQDMWQDYLARKSMISINQMKLPVEHSDADIKKKIENELELRRIFKNMPSFDYKIIRKSIDARKKPDIRYIYTVAVKFNKDSESQILKKCRNKNVSVYNPAEYLPKFDLVNKPEKHPLIIGEGPAGLFAGLILSYAGFSPVIIERGDRVDKRIEKVEGFWKTGDIDENTNVQFGEGGAGTFSDGKLNTLVKDKTGKNQFVLDTFVKFGAKKECAYDAKPHVGTDVLADVVKNIRNEIIDRGGFVLNSVIMKDIVTEDGFIKSIIVDDISEVMRQAYFESIFADGIVKKCDNTYVICADDLIIATGHSSRDTFRMLNSRNVNMEQKNFAVGLRIQHPQNKIDDSQYGKGHSDKLPPSPYKVTNRTSNDRNVFSFCMCPGGYVVNASSYAGRTCVNGMSYSDRASENANSALIVAIDRDDFGSDDVLAGMELQERLEKKANELGKGKIPVQLFKDFESGKVSDDFGRVKPVFKGETEFANLRELFPETIVDALVESINKFGYTIEGFDDGDAILAAVESRTSSPVRITRDEKMQSNVKGIYPCGEGAGYAGGIMSAAMDGIRVAEAVISKYMN